MQYTQGSKAHRISPTPEPNLVPLPFCQSGSLPSTEPSPHTLATSAASPFDEDLSNNWALQEEASGSQQADASWEIVSGAGLSVEDRPSQGGACAFSDAFVSMTDGGVSGLVLPWETPLMPAIFSDDIPASMGLCEPKLAIPGDAPQVPVAELAISGGRQSTPRAASGSSWAEQAIMPLLDEVPADKSSRLLAHCVTKWRLILNRYHSEQSTQTFEDDEIEACFGTRSVRTIAKRANSCLAFLRWFDVMGPMHLRPFCDEASWSYIGFVRRSGAGASCASMSDDPRPVLLVGDHFKSNMSSQLSCRFVTTMKHGNILKAGREFPSLQTAVLLAGPQEDLSLDGRTSAPWALRPLHAGPSPSVGSTYNVSSLALRRSRK